jgi:uncharacterized protein with HEPN domain
MIKRKADLFALLAKHEPELKSSQIPWRDLAGMRDRLIHSYFELTTTSCGRWQANKAEQLLPEFRRILTDERNRE